MEDFDVVTGPSPGKIPARTAPSPRPSPRGEKEKSGGVPSPRRGEEQSEGESPR